MILSFDTISKSYGAHLVLDNVTAKIEDCDRIGLVGPNGAGKSTLLHILTGELEPDNGSVARGEASFGFLRQNAGLDRQGTIHTEMLSVFSELLEKEKNMRKLEQEIAKTEHHTSEYKSLTARYAQLQTEFESQGGYMIQVKINMVLNGMGFGDTDRQTPVSVLSGGEKTRLALCKLLLEEPKLLILDEPTNHLDFQTLSWLEDYLQQYKYALLVVSHDRYFLDKLCTSIWEIEHHHLQTYKGNYSHYTVQKQERYHRLQKEYEAQQVEIAELKDFVARNMARASTTGRAKSKQKTLDKMEIVERPKPPEKPVTISFEYKREPVKDILHIEKLSLSVGQGEEHKQLLEDVDFSMLRGQKIALIGANGVGKSSFLKAIQNLIPLDSGRMEWGKNTDISYFEQEEFALHSQKTVLDELWDRFPQEYEHTIRTVLGKVRIVGENVYKKVGQLSGGERARLKFAILLLTCGNVLIMDEPTNHLDLATREVLDAALRDYTGTLLVVSHDRYLLNKFPTHIAEMFPDRIEIYPGNYDQYVEQKARMVSPTQQPDSKKELHKEKPANSYYRSKKQRSEAVARKKRLEELEQMIETLEKEIFELENEIASPEIAADYVLLQENCNALEEKRITLGCCVNEWAQCAEECEG